VEILPLMEKILVIAVELNARQAIPYTVSVGIAITPFFSRTSAASVKAFGCWIEIVNGLDIPVIIFK
jgi:hypothetical protein